MQRPEFILGERVMQAAEITRDIKLSGYLGKTRLLKYKRKTKQEINDFWEFVFHILKSFVFLMKLIGLTL